GIMFLTVTSVEISHSSIVNNTVNTTWLSDKNPDLGYFSKSMGIRLKDTKGSGGGVMVDNSLVILRGVLLQSNYAEKSGGALGSDYGDLQLEDVHLRLNWSSGSGGGLGLSVTLLLLSNLVLIDQNYAYSHGGAMACVRGNIISRGDTQITSNAVLDSGGGFYLFGCTLETDERRANLSVVDNKAGEHGGAAMLQAGSQLWLPSGGLLEMNECGDSGGALYLDKGCHAWLVNVALRLNSAGERGGAGVSAGTMNISSSSFVGNRASRGAALGLHLEQGVLLYHSDTYTKPSQTVISDTVFDGNAASGDGAVLHVMLPSMDHVAWPILENLSIVDNVALGGAKVLFWEVDDGPPNASFPPEFPCFSCLVLNNSAAYSTEKGYATPGQSLQVRAPSPGHEETSGATPRVPLEVRLVDTYGLLVSPQSTGVLSAELSSEDSECDLSGTTRKPFLAGAVTFDNLILSGPPGSRCHLRFSSYLDGQLLSANHAVQLRFCVAGEELHETGFVCITCPPEYLSFDNASACTACPDGADANETVLCPGGAVYVVPPGVYVASGAAECGTGPGAASCLLERVEVCDTEDACDMDGGRREGRSAADARLLELCDTERYGGGVLCGGTDPLVCSESHYLTPLKECVPCPSEAELILSISLAAAAVAVIAVVIVKAFVGAAVPDPQSSVSNAILGRKANAATSTLLAYAQVIGQLSSVYGSLSLPLFERVTSIFSVFNIDLETLFNLKCFLYRFGGAASQGTNHFWVAHYYSMAKPWIVLGLSFVGFLVSWGPREGGGWGWWHFRVAPVARESGGGSHKARARAVGHRENSSARVAQMANQQVMRAQERLRLLCTCLTVGLFIATFLHTSVSTACFMVFNCEKHYLDNLAVQQWLVQSRNVECKGPAWLAAATVSALNIALFVFGYPCGLYVFMRHMRRYKKVRMTSEDAKVHHHKILTREWIPASVSTLQILQEERTRRNSNQFLLPEDQARAATASEGSCELYIHEASLSFEPVDSYIGGDSPEAQRGLQQGVYRHVLLEGERIYVEVLQKESMVDGGVMESVAVTRLHEPHIQIALGQFWMPFEDSLYFWQCWEIARCALMTGGVILVNMITGSEEVAAIYATLLAVFALVLHKHYSPYCDDAIDKLQLMVLASQFFTQMGIITTYMMENNTTEQFVTFFLLFLQVIVMSYGVKHILPLYSKIFMALWHLHGMFIIRLLGLHRFRRSKKVENVNDEVATDGGDEQNEIAEEAMQT
ncbi:hypothetical protein CYMTET_20643, partial [Cymbomonas tetramitiformis]